MEACPPDAQGVIDGGAAPTGERSVAGRLGDGTWKRPLDLVIATAATVGLMPLIAVVALMVRIDSRGPVFFRQERLGRDGRPFRMWKFRSMYHNSDDGRHRDAALAWFAAQSNGHGYKSLADPRITRVGRFLRRTSLDEIPQLFNVLSGDMSLVGPRPAIAYELAHYQPWYFERQRVKPGMTGLWQVSGRDTVSAQDMMALDVRYVREHTLWLDFRILVLTVPALLGRYSVLS
ncbi:MAG: sugar transferase [Chloroflexi bacterium]|nr:MAG: sugar transferase [Chloroflexota bacterium]TME57795.1 MAG: sugar transferase [Chloroflexota bacterium]